MTNKVETNNRAFKAFCVERGYSGAVVAADLSISKPTVYAYFQGTRVPSVPIMRRIRNLYGIDPLDLFDVEEEKEEVKA